MVEQERRPILRCRFATRGAMPFGYDTLRLRLWLAQRQLLLLLKWPLLLPLPLLLTLQ